MYVCVYIFPTSKETLGTWLAKSKILFTQVCQTIQTELGKSMNDLFLDFNKTPLATASVRSLDYCLWWEANMNSYLG